MRQLWIPEEHELRFHWTATGFQIIVENNCGDTFVLEFDEATIGSLAQHILTAWGWQFEEEEEQETLNELDSQQQLPF